MTEERTPEIVWNKEARDELWVVLKLQLGELEHAWCSLIKDLFEYSYNKDELRI